MPHVRDRKHGPDADRRRGEPDAGRRFDAEAILDQTGGEDRGSTKQESESEHADEPMAKGAVTAAASRSTTGARPPGGSVLDRDEGSRTSSVSDVGAATSPCRTHRASGSRRG